MDAVDRAHTQGHAQVRFEWGVAGAEALEPAEIAVVVDVLCFTTAVSIAVDRHVEVHPVRWEDEGAAAYAEQIGATLALGRDDGLSPVAMSRRGAGPVVLRTPNGATVTHTAAQRHGRVVAASLRNAAAVAAWIRRTGVPSVAVIAAGERWPDASLRPAIEDLWGAGAVIDELRRTGARGLSAEAVVAAEAFAAIRSALHPALAGCASGIELIERGYRGDVEAAAHWDTTRGVPLLEAGRFVRVE